MSHGATNEGTANYAGKFRGVAGEGHFRIAQGLVLSSLGIGTYLGNPNDATDSSYTAAIVAAVQSGINVIDSAINYRLQRSERNVGAALKVLANKGFSRDEIVVCTKGGYLLPTEQCQAIRTAIFLRNTFRKGSLRPRILRRAATA